MVATSNSQIPYLDYLQGISVNERLRQGTGVQSSSQNDSSIPAYFLSGDDARDMEPDLSPAVNGAVIMTETGILDRRGLIQSLEKEVEEEEYLETPVGVGLGVGRRIRGKGDGRGHGMIVRGTRVVRIDADEKGGWVVQLESGWNGEEGVKGEIEAVRAQVVVNAAGVGGAELTEGVRSECGRVPEEVVRGELQSFSTTDEVKAHVQADICCTQGLEWRMSRASFIHVPRATAMGYRLDW